MTEDQLQLVKDQIDLEQETGGNYIDSSLYDTLLMLLSTNYNQKAEKMRKQFKVSDKRWWWIKVTALGDQRNFSDLEAFGKSKKSPIGYMPFIESCVRNNAPREAEKYVSKIAKDQQVAALVKIGNMRAAGDMAIQTKNVSDLELVYKRCSPENRDVQERVRNFLQQLRGLH